MIINKKHSMLSLKNKSCLILRPKKALFFLIIALSFFGRSFSLNAIDSPVVIEHISLDEAHQVLILYGRIANENWVDDFKNNTNNVSLELVTDSNTLEDLVILRQEQLSDYSFTLYAQLPLSEALYKVKRRTFILKLKTYDGLYESRLETLLGSTLRTYDLRAYTNLDKQAIIIMVMLTLGVISLLLMLIHPLYQKYRFKRNYVKKYAAIKEDHESLVLDPFTFVEFQDNDKVVVINEDILLLSSWKRLLALPESKAAKDLALFFKEREEGTFFNPKSNNFKKINHAWYGVVGLCFGWLLFTLGVRSFVSDTSKIVGQVINSKNTQVSEFVIHDILFGLSLALCFGVAISFTYRKKGKIFQLNKGSIKKLLWRLALVGLAMSLQAIINTFLIHIGHVSELLSWTLLGVALCIPLDFKNHFKNRIFTGILSGCIAFFIYQILSTAFSIDYLGVNFVSLLAIASLGLCIGLIPEINVEKIKASKKPLKLRAQKLLNYKKEPKDLADVSKTLSKEVKTSKEKTMKRKKTTKKASVLIEDVVENN